MRRSHLIAAGIAAMAIALAGLGFFMWPSQAKRDAAQWAAYKARFVTSEGRVVDTGNNAITHSEGQGWGMLFAETFGDRETFDRIWGWTTRSLQWQGSRLFAWKWVPGQGDPVPDPNNATDGDLLIAWALERASVRWQEPSYAAAGRAIAADIRRLLVAQDQGRPVLLPAFDGFDEGGKITVNLSYYVFPAFAAMERLDPSPQWAALRRNGMALLGEARFGRWNLPADWMSIDEGSGRVSPATRWPARFGYDAVRIPLYLIWSGIASPDMLEPYRNFWSQFGDEANLPGWAALDADAHAPYAASAGMKAVMRLVAAQKAGQKSPRPDLPEIGPDDDYYSASLILLTRLAAREAPATILPATTL